jgi:hypothetical protein
VQSVLKRLSKHGYMLLVTRNSFVGRNHNLQLDTNNKDEKTGRG